ncbi:MAG TPA: TetR-like C-terminal domain-containing protein [Mobilitalea sp.]|nr:TetR-like C-terminal domain-containing protein [Mobilitalea sp.]
MAEKKEDKRIRYTKIFLKESLINLLKVKPINKITIKEICDGADVNRATFYAYYNDPQGLLEEIELEVRDNINNHLNSFNYESEDSELKDMMKKILEYVNQNAELCMILIGQNGETSFVKKLTSFIQERYIRLYQLHKSVEQVTAEYIYTFVASGCVGIIQKWMVEGRKISTDEMAELLVDLAINGINNIKM